MVWLIMILVLFAILCFVIFRSYRKKNNEVLQSRHVVLKETEESRRLTEKIRPVMEATYKKAFYAENIEETIRMISQSAPSGWPKKKIEGLSVFDTEECDGTTVYVLQKAEEFDAVLIYLHGGAYLYEMTDLHAELCTALAVKTGARVIVPLYPRLPEHHCEDAYAMMLRLYQQVQMSGKPVILAGDSSGGGLALGFYQFVYKKQMVQPAGLLLISPWLDVRLSNPAIPEYESKDMMLAAGGLRRLGKLWAGDLAVNDYRVSPINGDLEALPETLIFVGTEEITYPDILRFYKKTKGHSAIDFVEGEGLYHIFAASDMTEQGRRARIMMIEWICRIKKRKTGVKEHYAV